MELEAASGRVITVKRNADFISSPELTGICFRARHMLGAARVNYWLNRKNIWEPIMGQVTVFCPLMTTFV